MSDAAQSDAGSGQGRPLLIWDGECGFCGKWIARWRAITGDRVRYAPYQQVADQYPQIGVEAFREAVHLVQSDGSSSRGAEAVLRALASTPGRRWPLWAYRRVPGVGPLCDVTYRFVARRRDLASTLTRWGWGERVEPPSYAGARWLFLRLLGPIYLIAFVSLSLQIVGLVGEDGILPAGKLLQYGQSQLGAERYWQLPTLLWMLGSSSAVLELLCYAGMALSVLLLLDVATAPVLVLLWAIYLSLATAAQIFLAYQWDSLLLQAGLFALFVAPLRLRPRRPGSDASVSWPARWLLTFLLLQLMLGAGVVKLASQDPSWRDLTALTVHYETQPLPHLLSWYAHQLPVWLHKAACALTLAIELIVPLFIFGPPRLRRLAALLLALLQLAIMATGNYGFFNLLAIALCVWLVDDARWPRWLQKLFAGSDPARPAQRGTSRWRTRWIAAPLATVLLCLMTLQLAHAFGSELGWARPLVALQGWLEPFRAVNSYGLFAHMTTSRPELVIEGSDDGKRWRPYTFRYKPSDLHRAPRFAFAHMPRLDLQLWFAAWSSVDRDRWVGLFLYGLLRGSPAQLALVEGDPFAGRPPRYVRAMRYDYSFTDRDARRRSGRWWHREFEGAYTPVLSLELLSP